MTGRRRAGSSRYLHRPGRGDFIVVEPQTVDVGFNILGILCFLPVLLIGLLGTVFWLWMLVDCLTKEPSTGNDKIVWAIVILVTHLLGAALYYFIRRPQRISEHGS
jgi:hypothetical protein